MVGEVLSGMVSGIEGELITVQADVCEGLPVFHLIGYLSSEVKEAKERVRSAFKNSGYFIPPKRIAVNLAPADIRKSGSIFDLAIAVSLFVSFGIVHPDRVKGKIFLGELSLDGSILPVTGILPIVKYASTHGIKSCLVACDNAKEAALIEEMQVYAFHNLKEVVSYLTEATEDYLYIDRGDHITSVSQAHIPDLSDVKGQGLAKRALEIAVAGYHNLYLDGPPGVGKSLLASCIPGIMPEMSLDEQLDVTMIYSVKGMLDPDSSLIKIRPFRAPSHSSTVAGLFGGGARPKPGEISLAHHGVLFLDEFPEFKREIIDMFRLPLENHSISLVRNERTINYPADFILVTAANPCPCGYYPDRNICRCTIPQIQAYRNKISGPIMDRMDLYVRCDKITYEELTTEGVEESSAQVKSRIEKVWKIQRERSKNWGMKECSYNGRLSNAQLQEICTLDGDSEKLMKQVYQTMHLTGRAYHRVLKVARTIADLEGKERIERKHLEEALLYRRQTIIR